MHAWMIEIESAAGTRPHRLDERVLSSVTEAIDADPTVFDADIIGDSDRIRATFEVLADDAAGAAASARAAFARALRSASPDSQASDEALVERIVVASAAALVNRD
jgi:PAB1-binding protein PBP1